MPHLAHSIASLPPASQIFSGNSFTVSPCNHDQKAPISNLNGSAAARYMITEPAPVKRSRIKPGRRSSLLQVLDLQKAAFDVAMSLREDALNAALSKEQRAKTATALSNMIKAWDSAEDRKRIIRGKPLPGSLRPEKAKPKKSPTTFATPEE